jgi:hypothetical protein
MKRCYEMRFRLPTAAAIVFVLLLMGSSVSVRADPPTLLVELGGEKRQFSATELLVNPATMTIEIPQDVSYRRAMRYQAIPLLELLQGLPADATHTLEARATDGSPHSSPGH